LSDALNTIVPIVLIFIAIVWVWSQFGEPLRRFYEWIKGLVSSKRERFQPPTVISRELIYGN
jgi:hypothetical protein